MSIFKIKRFAYVNVRISKPMGNFIGFCKHRLVLMNINYKPKLHIYYSHGLVGTQPNVFLIKCVSPERSPYEVCNSISQIICLEIRKWFDKGWHFQNSIVSHELAICHCNANKHCPQRVVSCFWHYITDLAIPRGIDSMIYTQDPPAFLTIGMAVCQVKTYLSDVETCMSYFFLSHTPRTRVCIYVSVPAHTYFRF